MKRRPRGPPEPPASVPIRNVVVAGHRTSVRLEPVMWDALRDIARGRDMAVNDLGNEIDRQRRAPRAGAEPARGDPRLYRRFLPDRRQHRSPGGAGPAADVSYAASARNARKS